MDLIFAHQAATAARNLFFHDIAFVMVAMVTVVVTIFGVAIGRGVMGLVIILHHVAHQRFAVGHRDLVIVRMDFVEGQEAMAIAAIFHERSLKARFDPSDLG